MDRIDILQRILNLPSKNEQDLFIQSLIEIHDVKQRRPRKDDSARTVDKMYTYFVMVGNQRTPVCYKAFLSLLSISDKRVKRLRSLAKEGKNPLDKRGKAPSVNRMSIENQEKIRSHIQSFPTKLSHYAGRATEYLDARLSIKTMYDLLVAKHPGICSPAYFYEFFHENFNLRFGRPQIDTCSTCEELSIKLKNPHLNDAAKRVATAELMVHKRRAKKFYNKIQEEAMNPKNESHVLSICMDFMQNLSIPQIPVQQTFYLRQITVNVFSIHNIKQRTAKVYVYHEGEANKTPNEVCSFLYEYLKEVPSEVTELRLFADNCGGQNKNHTLTRFLLMLTDTGRFEKVTMFFPVRGHSFLPCDRDFATIKRHVKKYDRIYTVGEIRNLIESSSTKLGNNPKFVVKEVESSDILNFKALWPTYYKKSCISQETNKKSVPKANKIHFEISSYRQMTFNKNKQGIIYASKMIDSIVSHSFKMCKDANAKPTLPPAAAYQSNIPIKTAKLNDVRHLLPYIPQEHLEFYKSIMDWPTVEGIDPEIQDD